MNLTDLKRHESPRPTSPGCYQVLQDGMVRRWCYDKIGHGCSHYIAPRYATRESLMCPEHPAMVDSDYDPYWFMTEDPFSIDKSDIIEFMAHQLTCRYCLIDMNCYLFPGYYDLDAGLLEPLIDAYRKYYPDNLVQPSFFVWYNNQMTMRLRCDWGAPDVEHGVANGVVDLDTLKVHFTVITATEPEFRCESFIFDLRGRDGWDGLLRVFPQQEASR